jgi:hypothetical protein
MRMTVCAVPLSPPISNTEQRAMRIKDIAISLLELTRSGRRLSEARICLLMAFVNWQNLQGMWL